MNSAISVVDQLLLSGLNFLIGVALIRFAAKETYGLYSQLMGAGLLSTTLLGALVCTALTTLAMRLDEHARRQMVARVARLQWLIAGVLAVVAGVAMGILDEVLDLHENPFLLAGAFALWIWALAAREYCRTALFIEGVPEKVASVDFVFVVLTLLGGVGLYWLERVTVTEIIFVMALSNALAAALPSVGLVRRLEPNTSRQAFVADARALWALSRWAVVGALLGWMGNNSYLYLTGGLVGVAALADMNAARLVLTPIVVIGTAWAKLAQPAMGQLIAQSNWRGVRQFMLKSLLAMEAFAVVYILAMWLFFPWLSAHFLGEKYQGIMGLVLMWAAYFAINAARSMGTILLTSFGAFRALFWQGAVSLVVLLALSWVLIPRYGVWGALAAMVAVELLELLTNHLLLIPRVKRSHLAAEVGSAA
ncbi:lipopolysaccharide biosynthesis protein [Rhodoferax aquaticus]|uniref:Polysaccharide biosynthesis protein n=1 Tax=Rhodoferax aquaticus TaxID=2527691 RepID=A0A515EL60_9BURK|nr:hypothetical protein [Rhodoferax aquaticus]QDL53400.1 hypothetical protein EXZ61_03970 [Rhodoferax aquaticus]